MIVLVKEPGKELVANKIEKDNLTHLQELVEGRIEFKYLSKEFDQMGIDVIVNEEYLMGGFEPSLALVNNNDISDIVFGNIIFAGRDKNTNDEELDSLSDEQIKFIKDKIDKAPMSAILSNGNSIPAIQQ